MKKLFIVLSVVLLMTPLAFAQDPPKFGYDPQDWEFTIQGSGNSDDDMDNTTLSVEASLAYFLTDSFELGLRQGIAYADRENVSDEWDGSSRLFADYNFNLGGLSRSLERWRPYLGVNLGYIYGDNVNETWMAGPEGGLKYFVGEKTFVQLLVEYNFTFDSADEIGDNFDHGRFVYALGMGFAW